ncbi:NAD(P)-binding protein [Pleomassaria siparia CBS 279.74]|uniref:NAD(P)-binding protein n=1 Tax=Pleomassaria siparia CBS 279.74 TaxID=1314801 RepID=A0A6G1JRT7_9PLEO|nr:NAD(P)-binding protein [Pleomassaria siparia CBS 279.74]
MAPKKLQISAASLGRIGHRHALNFLNQTPRAKLVDAFSPNPVKLQWAKQHLELFSVTLYDNYNEMFKQKGLDAVVISTATSVHAEEAIKAIEKNLHVLCKKRLSTDIAVCRDLVKAAKQRPHLKVMCGFSRCFDDSYRDAYDKVDQGLIRRPTILRSQTCDKHDPSGFFVAYAAWSGGVFVDMSVHDIDLTLWFFGDDIIPKFISVYGVVAVQPGLKQYTDYDNAVGIVEFHGGRIAHYYCSRMMAHGQEDVTEIISAWLQEALVTGKQITFNETGKRIEKAIL